MGRNPFDNNIRGVTYDDSSFGQRDSRFHTYTQEELEAYRDYLEDYRRKMQVWQSQAGHVIRTEHLTSVSPIDFKKKAMPKEKENKLVDIKTSDPAFSCPGYIGGYVFYYFYKLIEEGKDVSWVKDYIERNSLVLDPELLDRAKYLDEEVKKENDKIRMRNERGGIRTFAILQLFDHYFEMELFPKENEEPTEYIEMYEVLGSRMDKLAAGSNFGVSTDKITKSIHAKFTFKKNNVEQIIEEVHGEKFLSGYRYYYGLHSVKTDDI